MGGGVSGKRKAGGPNPPLGGACDTAGGTPCPHSALGSDFLGQAHWAGLRSPSGERDPSGVEGPPCPEASEPAIS